MWCCVDVDAGEQACNCIAISLSGENQLGTALRYSQVRIAVGMKSDSVGCIREQCSVCGYRMNLEAIKVNATV